MEKEKIIEKLDEINQELNGLIGRLTMLRNTQLGTDCHSIALEMGVKIDDLINELQ